MPVRFVYAGLVPKTVMGARYARHGVDHAAEYLQRFHFPAQNIVHTESLALGSASLRPAGRSRLFGDGQRLVNFLYQ
ncbi:hypothetical protein MJ561_27050 [Klebsiella pneumoniae]|nr:hypothetical protein MJ561_27050 [Klebsiella pneumoniae]